MIDPVEIVLRWYFSLWSEGPAGVILQAIVICAVVCLFLPDLLESNRRSCERRVARQSRELIQRIKSLLPIYEETVSKYLEVIERNIADNPKLLELAEKLPHELKIASERDFCLQDVKTTHAVSLLQMEAVHVLGQGQ